ncbi:DUF3667 domain-containing protein [Flavobacterium sp. 14A]|uniref:DUF3667 domain-containing protein n=1 Tax=Flavobacterium sp. 14A TaxID=2735896 RepID=UPI00156FE409|nr:DUF3667 domain-containing protein [Flavobacterium sp. 14A]NRT11429.1 hypothetical protein [Flavobacterium sp. 14A]
MGKIEGFEENKKLKRIDSLYIIHEIKHLLHLESGFLFTVKQLFISPGKLVRNFIFEDRSKVTKPLIFLIFSTTIFTLVLHSLHIEYQYFNIGNGSIDSYLSKEALNNWLNNHVGYASLFFGFLIALWTMLFFKKHKYNIYEITILLCYSFGQLFLILLSFSLIGFLFKNNSIAFVGVVIGYLYVAWSIGQFFGEKKITNYVKSIFCCIFGFVSFTLIMLILALIFKQLGLK